MSLALIQRGSLTVATVVMAACSDLGVPRISLGARGDSTPERGSSDRPPGRGLEQRPGREIEATSFAEIRRTLRQLVAAEETFFAENGTYSDELPLMRVIRDRDITVRFLWLSRDGWAASGSHADLPGKDCVIFVGQAQAPPTTLKYVRSGRVGVPVCDDQSAPPRLVTAPRPTATAPGAAPAAAPPAADSASALDLLDPRVVMKVDLRHLAHSQETYLAMQGTYARRTESLALQYLWHRDVQVKILTADRKSWAAKATHARFPGKSCIIWFGAVSQRPTTDAQQRVETRAGVPVCDD